MQHLGIRTKLILIFSIIGIGIVVILNYLGFTTARDALQHEVYQKLIAVREIKKTQLTAFFDEKINDITILAQTTDVLNLFAQLVQYHNQTDVGADEPYDVTTPAYQEIYTTAGRVLNSYIQQYGYQDIYLLCKAHGHVMYTAARADDLGTNLGAGPYRDSPLADLWRRVVEQQDVVITDFQLYAPKGNQPAAFIGIPLLKSDTDELLGILALQLSVDAINKIMHQRAGLGDSGEAYLVGSDHLMRSDSFLDPEHHSVINSFRNPAKGKISTDAVQKALAGNSGADIIEDYRHVRVLSAYTPLHIRDTLQWALLAEMDEQEAFRDIYALRTQTIGWGAILVGVVVVSAILFARGLTRRLSMAVTVAQQVSEGNLHVEFQTRARDEVGRVLQAMKQMIAYIQEAAAVAERISNQDLQVQVTPKSAQDVLNQSLAQMVATLQQMMTENVEAMREIEQQNVAMQQQNWIKDGITQLSTTLTGNDTLRELCQKAINFTARYVNAGQGALYVYDADQEQLKLYGTFAFTEREDISNTYKLGEGIVGQVALERSPILLRHVTRAEAVITTGTVSQAPLNTYTFPLLYENTLYGVLELASTEPLQAMQQEVLEESNRVIATAMFSAGQKERVEELLRQSQQAEQDAEQARAEAQQQAEEARKSNVLLEEKQQELEQQNEEFQQMNAHLKRQQQELEQQREELRQQRERLQQAQ